MAVRRTGWRMAMQGTMTLFVVVGLYASPVLLSTVFGGPDGQLPAEVLFVGPDDGREVVFWTPPSPPAPVEESVEDAEPEPVEPVVEAPSSEEEPAEVTSPTQAEAVPGGLASAAGRGPVVARHPRLEGRVARRTGRRPTRARTRRAPTPPPSLQEARKRAKRIRRAERRAERKQCGELTDLVVATEEEDHFWVGRELVNCYRTHPQQFFDIGGAWWHVEDEKKRGVRIHLSSRARGDIARAAGFRKGDVVRSINGIPIRSDATGALAATQILRARAKVRILRDDVERTLHFRVVNEDRLEEKRLEMAALAGVEPPNAADGEPADADIE